MFKVMKYFFIIMLGLMVTSGTIHAEDMKKIGFVDLSRLFDEYFKTKDYDKVLESKHKTFTDERQKMIDEIQAKSGKLGVLKDKERENLEADVEQLKAKLLEFDRQRKTDLTKERNEKIREILLEIEKIVSDFAEKEGYSVILNDRVLIFGDKAMDLTEKILTLLNQQKPKK